MNLLKTRGNLVNFCNNKGSSNFILSKVLLFKSQVQYLDNKTKSKITECWLTLAAKV